MLPNNVFIYLIGLPGAGKLTIARELQKRVPSILVDSHFINNTVFGLIDTDGVTPLPPRVWHLRILVSQKELCRRVVSPERKGQLKSIDPDEARKNWETYEVLNPEGCFDLEVSELSPSEAAHAIVAELEKRMRA